MANTVKGIMHRVGRFLVAPFMGYVWMARCKDLIADNERLTKRNAELSKKVADLQASFDTQGRELRAKTKRIIYLTNENDRICKMYADLTVTSEKTRADYDTLHGYALDLDAQITDYRVRTNRIVFAIQNAPSMKRLNKSDFNAIIAEITGK